MSRPKKCRCVACKLDAYYFKPIGIPLLKLEEVFLLLDEVETLRLADLEGLHHEECSPEDGSVTSYIWPDS